MELVKNLGFVNVNEVVISEEQKQLVRNRIAASINDPERLYDWDDVKNEFKLD